MNDSVKKTKKVLDTLAARRDALLAEVANREVVLEGLEQQARDAENALHDAWAAYERGGEAVTKQAIKKFEARHDEAAKAHARNLFALADARRELEGVAARLRVAEREHAAARLAALREEAGRVADRLDNLLTQAPACIETLVRLTLEARDLANAAGNGAARLPDGAYAARLAIDRVLHEAATRLGNKGERAFRSARLVPSVRPTDLPATTREALGLEVGK